MFKAIRENKINSVDKCLKILGIDYSDRDKDILLNEICLYIFDTSQKSTENKVFDLEQDYKYYFCDFYKIGVNLNINEISWWEFNALLEGFFLDEKSTISTVLGYRTYKKPPKNIQAQENNQDKFYREMKRKYALKDVSNTENGFEKLWNYVESKVKNKEE